MTRWKHCPSTTFEIFPLSTCMPWQQNTIFPKVFKPILENFASARRFWGRAFEWKVFGAEVFSFSMARWELCPSTTFQSLPLSTCTLCQRKSYISKVNEPIFEIFDSARRFWGWAFAWKVSGTQVFYCCNGKVKSLPIDNIWMFATLNLYTVPENSYISKGIQPISKSLPELEDFERGHLGGKFEVRSYFTFAMARWKLCVSTTFESLPLSTCTLCQKKSYISKGIPRIFEIFALVRRCWGWALRWKDSGLQVFYFFNGRVRTLRIDNIWKFATFNL